MLIRCNNVITITFVARRIRGEGGRGYESNAFLNKKIFRRVLKTDKLSADLTNGGRVFQRFGAAILKARSAVTVRARGQTSMGRCEDGTNVKL